MFISDASKDALMVEIIDKSPLTHCILPLLESMQWEGSSRQLAEMIPYSCYEFTLFSLQSLMTRLNYNCDIIKRIDLYHLDNRLTPCLFISDEGDAYVIKSVMDKTLSIHNGEINKEEIIERAHQNGTVYLFHHMGDEPAEQLSIRQEIWKEHKGLIINIFFIGLMLNLLYLSVPLFIMGVYDSFIVTQSYTILTSFIVGIGLAILFVYLLLYVRLRVMAYVTVHIDEVVMSRIFKKLLDLPPSSIETAAVSSQVSQMKNFDLIYTFLSSRLTGVLLEIPFIAILLIAIAILGGYLALIPIFMIAIYLLCLAISLSKIKSFVNEMAMLSSDKQDFIIESYEQFDQIRYSSVVDVWCERFRNLSAESSVASFKLNLLVGIIGIISDVLMILTGVLIIYYGVTMATSGFLSMGALIAIFILIWRTLSPIRSVASAVITFEQVHSCIQQISRLMTLQSEVGTEKRSLPFDFEKADLKVENVTMRYVFNAPAVVQNVNFSVNQGEVLAIVGPNGSGKSTLLKILLGMYRTQVGAIYIDDRDIRQVDPSELRAAIAYVPQYDTLLYGTIRQNFRLVDPTVSDEEIYEATKVVGAYDEIKSLAQGFDTFLNDRRIDNFPVEFKRKICLARALVKKSKILVIDEGNLDQNAGFYNIFCNMINSQRKDKTIIFTTHNPDKLHVANKILYLEAGRQQLFGTKEEIISKVYRKLQ